MQPCAEDRNPTAASAHRADKRHLLHGDVQRRTPPRCPKDGLKEPRLFHRGCIWSDSEQPDAGSIQEVEEEQQEEEDSVVSFNGPCLAFFWCVWSCLDCLG